MFVLENNKLEIALVTYNRPKFVEKWISLCLKDFLIRNIKVSIYDSSTNNETENIVNDVIRNGCYVEYNKIDSNTSIGFKPIYPILKSESEYIWVFGDSRFHDINDLDNEVFPIVNSSEYDCILLQIIGNCKNDEVFYDKETFLRNCFISMTCIGMSIYKTELFKNVFIDDKKEFCKKMFDDNYAFAWLGYFLTAYSCSENNKSILKKILINDLLPSQKVQQWRKRFLESWIQNLCDLLDRIPRKYGDIDYVINNIWKTLKLDSNSNLIRCRVSGELNIKTLKHYIKNGMIYRATNRVCFCRILCLIPKSFLKILMDIQKN